MRFAQAAVVMFIVATTVSHVVAQELKIKKCAYELGRDVYLLDKLKQPLSDPYRVYRGATSYSFNVCDAVGGCGANLPSAACKSTSLGGMETAIGNANNPSVHRLSMEDITWINQQTGHQPPYNMQNGGLGIKMVYTGMPSYGAAGVTDEHVTIMIPCDSGALFAHPLKYLQGAKFETAVDGYIFVLPSIHGCPTNKALPDMGDTLSFGWVFIILFLVSGAVYCFGGIAYKMHTLGVRGEEAIPHIEFWRELPGLIKEGLQFSQQRANELSQGAPERVTAAVQGNAYTSIQGTDKTGFENAPTEEL